jgi:lysophospholipase L1-like esterase
LVVAFPVPVKFQEDFPRSSYPPQLEKSARAEGLHYLDLEPIYRAAYQGHESLFIPYDGDHPNAAGHELAARAITDFLLSQSADLRHAGD